MKKILSMFLCAMMVFSMSSVAFAADFNDVTDAHAQYEAIETLETLDIVNGFSSDVYGPDVTLTRAQLCTMMVRAMYGDDIHYNDTTFADVALTHWARASIDTACRNGLMVGYGDNKFGPEDTLTYTQTARVILNAIGYGDLAWPTGVNAVAYELGLYDNVKVTDFNAGCTRAHAAQMIFNAFDLHLVKEWAGEHFNTDKVFVNDVLGFEKTSEYVDGHLYVAYKNLKDKKADLLVTDIRSTFEKTIYPVGNDEYKFIDSTRAEKHDVKWSEIEMYVNGVLIETGRLDWFKSDFNMVGVFDDEDTLIAIYVVNEGDVYIPGEIPADILSEVEDDDDFDARISTITYFVEDDTYVISNEIVCGFVSDISSKSIWIDDVKYTLEAGHGFEVDEFAVIYIDSNDEIAGWTTIDEPYHFNVKSMKYHTWECSHYNDRANDNNWCIGEDAVIKYFIDNDKTNTTVRFDACKDCHADGRYAVSIPEVIEIPDYVTHDDWTYVHTSDCSAVTSKPDVTPVVVDLIACTKPHHDCIIGNN